MTTLKNIPIGLSLPIQSGNVGYFDQTFDSFSAYRMNIINLLRTIPGERRMNPMFGTRLWTITFDPNDDMITPKVEKIIKEDISAWIPGVTVSSVQVKYADSATVSVQTDIYKLYIAVKYVVDSINQEDVVEIVLNAGKI